MSDRFSQARGWSQESAARLAKRLGARRQRMMAPMFDRAGRVRPLSAAPAALDGGVRATRQRVEEDGRGGPVELDEGRSVIQSVIQSVIRSVASPALVIQETSMGV